MMIRTLAIGVLTALALAGCKSPPVNRTLKEPLPTVAQVDLERYAGRWYEIARLPNSFEANCEGVTADYRLREDGLIDVVNTCRKGAVDGKIERAKGKARRAEAGSTSKLEVSFFGPFWGDYWIIDLAEDYSLSLVGEPSGRYLWILARTPEIDAATRDAALARLSSLGYDVRALYFPKQPPVPDNPDPFK